MFPSDFNRDLCKAVAIETLCDAHYEDMRERQDCIWKKADESKSLLACSLLKDDDERNLCLATVTGDTKYCEEIKDETLRNICLSGLSTVPAEVKEEEEECGGLGQPPCQGVERCQEGLEDCPYKDRLCGDCGCRHQKCCAGDTPCYEPGGVCAAGICLGFEDQMTTTCDDDSDCPCPLKKCVDGICEWICGSDTDCQEIDVAFGGTGTGAGTTCKDGICQ